MKPSFAQFNRSRLAILSLSLLLPAACATLPPPTQELAAAEQAVSQAGNADADQYAPELVESARAELSQAQAAMAAGNQALARDSALAAAAGGDLANAQSRARVLEQDLAQRQDEIAELRARLRLDRDGDVVPPVPPLAADVDAMGPVMRLQALDADPRFAGRAAYERLRAQQAVDALEAARSKARPAAAVVASRRVAIAEVSARNELLAQAVARLDRTRSELLVESSRREAENARQEAERLRVQAQIQAEEAGRLRAAAAAEAAARQQAEDVILDVGGEQADKLRAARQREAELARQEAELLKAQEAAATPEQP
jgi:hypothetical protein